MSGPTILSAYVGLVDAPAVQQAIEMMDCQPGNGDPNALIDGMSVTFSKQVDESNLAPEMFRIIVTDPHLSHNEVINPDCVSLTPADDSDELHTVLMLGEFAGPSGDKNYFPTQVEIDNDKNGNALLSVDGEELTGLHINPVTVGDANGPGMVMAKRFLQAMSDSATQVPTDFPDQDLTDGAEGIDVGMALRIDCGSAFDRFTGSVFWGEDDSFVSGGYTWTDDRFTTFAREDKFTIAGAGLFNDIYKHARIAEDGESEEFIYTITNLEPFREYKIFLYFSEHWFTNAGDRTMDVLVNEEVWLDDFDVFAEAGGKDIALVKFNYFYIVEDYIEITFVSVTDAAFVNGIAIYNMGYQPSEAPSDIESGEPSESPTLLPSESPSLEPKAAPSAVPSFLPSTIPSTVPSFLPSTIPSTVPSFSPSTIQSTVQSGLIVTIPIIPQEFSYTLPEGTESVDQEIIDEIVLQTNAFAETRLEASFPDRRLQGEQCGDYVPRLIYDSHTILDGILNIRLVGVVELNPCDLEDLNEFNSETTVSITDDIFDLSDNDIEVFLTDFIQTIDDTVTQGIVSVVITVASNQPSSSPTYGQATDDMPTASPAPSVSLDPATSSASEGSLPMRSLQAVQLFENLMDSTGGRRQLQNPAEGSVAWINEYNQKDEDEGGFVEVAYTSSTDISHYTVYLYDGNNGKSYFSSNIPSGAIIDGIHLSVISGMIIRNGGPNGVALVDGEGQVVEFLSWGGAFVASDGPALDQLSVEIGSLESGATDGLSMQRYGIGCKGSDFDWESLEMASPGALNLHQLLIFSACK